jgi:ribosome-binding protein aMBF1 (putative translation factor)
LTPFPGESGASWRGDAPRAANPTALSTAEAFGAVLRRERRARELSQRQLAERAGRSVKHVGEIERGKRSPGLHTLRLLAGALDVGAGEMVTRAEERWEGRDPAGPS